MNNEAKPIRLSKLNDAGSYVFVDSPAFGNLQPDHYAIYNVGLTNRPIPTYHPLFISQFMKKAEELNIRHLFA